MVRMHVQFDGDPALFVQLAGYVGQISPRWACPIRTGELERVAQDLHDKVIMCAQLSRP
ncbi:hypothetical protein [Streptomyces africanus]|uniref:hypothetical protein n=1 Tax=Streptomyces africanus TaxID=231024 RepID=UPI0013025D4E|nr:hypothetical protein [Streptomyces africanus]